MKFGYGFTDLLLTIHAGLPAFAQLLKSARLRTAFGPSVKMIPVADIFACSTAVREMEDRHLGGLGPDRKFLSKALPLFCLNPITPGRGLPQPASTHLTQPFRRKPLL